MIERLEKLCCRLVLKKLIYSVSLLVLAKKTIKYVCVVNLVSVHQYNTVSVVVYSLKKCQNCMIYSIE